MSLHAWSPRSGSRVRLAQGDGRRAANFRPRLERLETRVVPSFSAPFLYPAGPFPRSVAVGDFNGDGYPDIVTANDGTGNSISVLLNNGDGTFQAPVNYPAGSQPVQVVVGDFNGDGRLDLAVANTSSNNVSIFLGNGNGTFRPAGTVAASPNPRGLAVGDFNGDGIPDLVVACTDGYQTHYAYVLLGNGDGTFRLSERDPADTPISVTVGDFNGDGKLDFATADAGYQVSRYQGRGDGTFLPFVYYPAGHRVAQITNADFNHDGKLDLLTSGDTYGTFAILPGVGNGTFESPISSNDFVGSAWVEAADFNGDGKLDTATLRDDGDNVWLRLGNGDFTFQAYQQYRVGPGPGAHATTLAIADVNGDGSPDIIVADRSFDYVAVLLNQPAADHFGVSAPASSVAGTSFNVTVSALNPGGQTDPNYQGRVHFTSSDGQASLPSDYTFTAADNGQHTFSVTLRTAGSQTVTATDTSSASFTGSATVAVTPAMVSRLVVARFPSPVTAGTVHTFGVAAKDAYGNTVPDYTGTVHFTSSDPQAIVPEDYTFTAADQGRQAFGAVLRTAGPQSITATDIVNTTITGTQSGIVVDPAAADHLALDAPPTVTAGAPFPLTVTAQDPFNNTATGFRGTVHLSTSDPGALFPPDYTYTAADAGVHTFTVSLATPGEQTITAIDVSSRITGSTVVQVLSMLFEPAVNYNVGLVPYSGAVGDSRGIGTQDLVTADYNAGTVSVLLGNGDGSFKPAVDYSAGSSPIYVVVGDFNGDGRIDLATANWFAGTVSVLLGNGGGTFQAPRSFAAGSLPGGMVVGDFNGDGNLDLAVADSGSSGVGVLLGNGDGTFRPAVTYGTGLFARDVKAGDFNGDGHLDLAVVNQGPNTVSVLLGNGDGTFRTAVDYATDSYPTALAVADLNGDGAADLVVANYLGNTVSVLLGNGDGSFRSASTVPCGQGPGSVQVADVDGDGIPDVIATSSGTNSVSVLRGNGDGSFQPALSFAVGRGPKSVTVGDFNGDGLPDLAAANGDSNTVSVLLHGSLPALPQVGSRQGNVPAFDIGSAAALPPAQPEPAASNDMWQPVPGGVSDPLLPRPLAVGDPPIHVHPRRTDRNPPNAAWEIAYEDETGLQDV